MSKFQTLTTSKKILCVVAAVAVVFGLCIGAQAKVKREMAIKDAYDTAEAYYQTYEKQYSAILDKHAEYSHDDALNEIDELQNFKTEVKKNQSKKKLANNSLYPGWDALTKKIDKQIKKTTKNITDEYKTTLSDNTANLDEEDVAIDDINAKKDALSNLVNTINADKERFPKLLDTKDVAKVVDDANAQIEVYTTKMNEMASVGQVSSQGEQNAVAPTSSGYSQGYSTGQGQGQATASRSSSGSSSGGSASSDGGDSDYSGYTYQDPTAGKMSYEEWMAAHGYRIPNVTGHGRDEESGHGIVYKDGDDHRSEWINYYYGY